MSRTLSLASCLLLTASLSSCDKPAASTDATSAGDDGWVSLFNGKDLTGWSIESGTATYRIEDGAIVGKNTEGSPNTFLCTEKKYGDFEFEFEVKVADELNSGVQIRSIIREKDIGKGKNDKAGRLYGPQCEIEASPGQAGFIYGEATGLGWLSPEPGSDDEAVSQHSHMKNGKWNQFRIVAKGPNIKTFINGNAVADLTHEEIYQDHASGLIGLQVHGIKKGTGPFEVSWRNLRIKELK